ncbi:MAG: SIR2 family NAD-dependent protein deacylase [Acidimicrobiales bacterium]
MRVGADRSQSMAQVRSWVAATTKLVVLTGAGISTDSGIPDYRGPKGTWTLNPQAERTATLSHYLADPEVRRQAWQNRLASPAWGAQPNDGHRALVDLERRGRLSVLITQNIDELHQKAGSAPERVLELHGTMHHAVCWSCGDRRRMTEILDRVRAGEPDPACESCGGILKSATISFGQDLDAGVLAAAHSAAMSAEVFMAVGTSLGVFPAARLVPVAEKAGARLVIVNDQPTPFDSMAHAIFRQPIGEVLPQVARSVQI